MGFISILLPKYEQIFSTFIYNNIKRMENELKKLARQLSCPEGEKGKKLAEKMNLNNLPVILNGYSNLQIQNNDHILELGYGNGGLLGYILSLAKDIRYTGLEISPTMHEEAISFNRVYIQAGLAQYFLFDGLSIPLESQTFDKIITINTLYFWENPIFLLKEIVRVLKTNGHFCLTFCDKSFMEKLPFTKNEFQLYDVKAVKDLILGLPFELIQEDHKQDKSISKTGILTDREFISLVFKKINE